MTARSFISFESLTGDNPAVAPVSRHAAAGANSNLRYADAPIDADEPGAPRANPAASVGNEYRFGSGPSFHQPGSIGQGRARDRVNSSAAAKFNMRRLCNASSALPSPARSRLKFSQIAQTAFDVFAAICLILFFFLFGCAVVMAFGVLAVVKF